MTSRVRKRLEARQIECCGISASLIFPQQFNDGLAAFGNKASLLGAATLQLAKRLIDTIDPSDQQDVFLLCDRLGGRTHYAGLLQQELTGSFVRVVYERRPESCYRWQEGNRNFESRFIVKGERMLPIALGSMVAKYLREISMDAWNSFWKQQLPDLQPTAGYPQDARRFKKEIASVQTKLKVADDLIWRKK